MKHKNLSLVEKEYMSLKYSVQEQRPSLAWCTYSSTNCKKGMGSQGSFNVAALFSSHLSGSLSDLAAGSGNPPAKLHLPKGLAPAVSKSASSAKVYQGKES